MFDFAAAGAGDATDPDLMFFAVLPTDEERRATISSVNKMRERAGIRAPIRAPHLLHMTVVAACYVLPLTADVLARLIAAGDRVVARSFLIEWDRAVLFRHETQTRALKLLAQSGVREARTLQRCAYAALEMVGLRPLSDDIPPPHVSLLYGRGGVSERIEPVSWFAKNLVLVQSFTGHTEYKFHKAWSLLPPLEPANSERLRIQQEFDFK